MRIALAKTAFPLLLGSLCLPFQGCKDKGTDVPEEIPAVEPINPTRLGLTVSGDTSLAAREAMLRDSLSVFASARFFEEDTTVFFSKAFDTLYFPYQSMEDDVYSNGISKATFGLTLVSHGKYAIQAEIAVFYDDVVSVGPIWKHSLTAGAVIPAGLPKGVYDIKLLVREACFCPVQPTPAVFTSQFTLR